MKINLKAGTAALAMLATLSILPGCGKSSDKGGGAAVNSSGIGNTGSSVGLSGNGCYYMNQISPGQGVSLTFQGNGMISPYDGSLQATLSGTSSGFPGAMYTRANAAGDTMQVYVSGSTVYALANLSPTTVAYFQMYSAPVCGIYIDSYISNNTLTLSSPILTQGGYRSGLTL